MEMSQFLMHFDEVKAKGKNKWTCLCPVHHEKTPSLAIAYVDDRILLHCFGCGADAANIVQSVGLRLSDLFNDGKIHEYKQPLAFAKIEKSKKAEIEEKLRLELFILETARVDREMGRKLSRDDLMREKRAFLTARRLRSQYAELNA